MPPTTAAAWMTRFGWFSREIGADGRRHRADRAPGARREDRRRLLALEALAKEAAEESAAAGQQDAALHARIAHVSAS